MADALSSAQIADATGPNVRVIDRAGTLVPVVVAETHARVYKGVETITFASGTVYNMTPSSGGTFALMRLDPAANTVDPYTMAIRFWHGSTDPGGTVGIMLMAGESDETASPATWSGIKASSTVGTPVLQVEYYGFE